MFRFKLQMPSEREVVEYMQQNWIQLHLQLVCTPLLLGNFFIFFFLMRLTATSSGICVVKSVYLTIIFRYNPSSVSGNNPPHCHQLHKLHDRIFFFSLLSKLLETLAKGFCQVFVVQPVLLFSPPRWSWPRYMQHRSV